MKHTAALKKYGPDTIIAAVLTAAAVIARRDVLPRDGLNHDDAWIVVGVTRGSMHNLLTVSLDHPGFTVALRAFSRLVGGPPQRLAIPVLIVGVGLPPALFLALRKFGYARSICVLLAAAVVGIPVVIGFSGRVKTYLPDAVIVLSTIAAVPCLVRMRWRWHTAIVAVVVSAVLSSMSVFALATVVTALCFVALESRRDRVFRVATALTVVIGACAYLIAVQRTYNGQFLEGYWTGVADAYVGFSENPLRLAAKIVDHLLRTGHAFPGGPSPVASMAAALAVTGIIVAAASRRHSSQQVRARYVGLLLSVALIGSIARRFVFGPTPAGLRVAIWMVPILGFGLAIVLHSVRSRLSPPPLTHTFDALLFALAVGVLFMTLRAAPLRYPLGGERSATRYVERNLGVHDVVMIVGDGVYGYAADTRLRVHLIATPHRIVGFAPVFLDPRAHVITYILSARDVAAADHLITKSVGAGTGRVFVYEVALSASPRALNTRLRVHLVGLGFAETIRTFKTVQVQMWVNARTRQLPPG